MTLGRAVARSGVLIAVTAFHLIATGSGEAYACAGDCDGDARVSVSELIRGVNIALGLAPVSQCEALELNSDRRVQIDELIAAVGRALEGCSATPTATPNATRGR